MSFERHLSQGRRDPASIFRQELLGTARAVGDRGRNEEVRKRSRNGRN